MKSSFSDSVFKHVRWRFGTMKSARISDALFAIVIITCVETRTTFNEWNTFLYSGGYISLNESDCRQTYQQFFVLEENCNDECDVSSKSFAQVKCISEAESVYFPKCCPPDYLYETVEHKCVKSDVNETVFDDLNFNVSLLKSGLENCRVIADYVFKKSDFVQQETIRIGSDRSLFYQEQSYFYGNYCFDKVLDSDDEFVLRLCHEEEFCKRRMKGDAKGARCIKKCCSDGQMFVGRTCAPRVGHGLPVPSQGDVTKNASGNFAVFVSDLVQKYIADKKRFKYHIDEEGTLFLNVSNQVQIYTINERMYCIESVSTMGDGIFFLQPRKDVKENINFKFSRVVLVISCIFLVLTLLAFTFLKELQNFLGKVLVCYCISLLAGFATIATMQFNPVSGYYCAVAGYLITFSFLAVFTWTTLISYDIWSVLGSMKMQYGNSKWKDIKKIILYNLVGWTVPALITGFMAFDNQYWILPESVHPYVGRTICLVEKHRVGNYGYFLYITGPSGVLILVNIIIYVKTISYIIKVKREIDRIRNKGSEEKNNKAKIFAADKERVTMVLKLFLIMGLNWTFDAIASVVDFKQNTALQVVEIIFDTFNGLQGVLIFCIFILKWKILRAFARKLGFKSRTFGTSSEVTSRTVVDSIIRKQ